MRIAIVNPAVVEIVNPLRVAIYADHACRASEGHGQGQADRS
jgi:hypothetical protein